MTDQEKPKRTVDQVEMTHPIYLTLDQTASKNSVKVFQGPNAKEQAVSHASERAVTLGRMIPVFGPQFDIKGPPAPDQSAVSVELFVPAEPVLDDG
jgi:hypothetical protein